MQVSVIVATYNRKDLLEKTIESLKKQDYSDYEIIVIDDGSTDGTEEITGMKYFKQQNKGPAAARNLGIKKSSGEIIAFTDDDCVPKQDWIKNLVRPFSDPKVGAVEGKTVSSNTTPFTSQVQNLRGGGFQTCNIAYRKHVIDSVQGFDENYLYAFNEDLDLAFKVMGIGSKIVFNENAIVHHPAIKNKLFNKKKVLKHLSDFKLYDRFPKLYKKYKAKNPYIGLFKQAFVSPIKRIIDYRKYFLRRPLSLVPFLIMNTLEGVYLWTKIILK